MNDACMRCAERPVGESGHEGLEFYVAGPYPGHSIFNCVHCGERWIRHHGITQPYAWTRYFDQFPQRRPAVNKAAKNPA